MLENNETKPFAKLIVAAARAGTARNMTVTQLAILAYLENVQTKRLGELSDSLKLDKSLVSRAMDRFEELGFARRYYDAEDRRAVIVGLTYKGRMWIRKIYDEITNSNP